MVNSNGSAKDEESVGLRSKLFTRPNYWLFGVMLPIFLAVNLVHRLGSDMAFSYEANTLHEPLSDVLHEWVSPRLHTDPSSLTYALPDRVVFVHTWTTAVFTCILAPSPARPIAIYMALLATLLLLRLSCFSVTTFPSPTPECRGAMGRLPRHSGFIEAVACNDLMFSGHTSLNTLDTMFFLISSYPWPVKALSAATLVFACFLSSITRDHYTVDVLVALYLAALLALVVKDHIRTAFVLPEIPTSRDLAHLASGASAAHPDSKYWISDCSTRWVLATALLCIQFAVLAAL